MEVGIFGVIDVEYEYILKNLKTKNKIINIVNPKKNFFFTRNVNKEIKYIFHNKSTSIKKELIDINIDINKDINKLSTSERLILKTVLSLYSGNIIIIKNIFPLLDSFNTKLLLSLLDKFKNSKLILVLDDINNIYMYIDKLYFNGKVFNTKEVLTDVQYLIDNNLDIPYLPLITYLSKKNKNVKLFYHNDVRDIIKDIYKHV